MKINLNSDKMKKHLLCYGLSVCFVLVGCHHHNQKYSDDQRISSSQFNTVSINDGQILLAEFQKVYLENEGMQKYLCDIYGELESFILKYGDYLDVNQIVRNLATVQFKDEERKRDGILAYYDYQDNIIYFTKRLYYKRLSQIKELKFHEMVHFFLTSSFMFDKNNKDYIAFSLDEGNAALIVKEAGMYDNTVCYDKNMYYVSLVAELVGVSKYREIVGNHDFLALISSLSAVSNKQEVIKLLKLIDQSCLEGKYCDIDRDIWSIIEKMYINKTGISIEESSDEVIKYLGNKLAKIGYDIKGARSYNHAVLYKNYFLDIEQSYFTFAKNQLNYGIVYLNSNNSVESGKVLQNGYFGDNNHIVDLYGNPIEDSYIDYSNSKQK